MGLAYFFKIFIDSVYGLLCRFVFSDIFGVLMGVWIGDKLEVLVGVSFSLDDHLVMEVFFKAAILEKVGDGDLTGGGETMMCCFVDEGKLCRGREANSFMETLLL